MIRSVACCPNCGATHNPLLQLSFRDESRSSAAADEPHGASNAKFNSTVAACSGANSPASEIQCEPLCSATTYTWLCETCGETYWLTV